MIFETKVSGIPCQCKVTYVDRDGEFEFMILDRKGYHANWLESKLTDDDPARLYQEYIYNCSEI